MLILNLKREYRYDEYYSLMHLSIYKRSVEYEQQTQILSSLSNKKLRDYYWSCYYNTIQKPSETKFQIAESKRVANVTKCLKQLSREEIKHESQLELLDLEKPIQMRSSARLLSSSSVPNSPKRRFSTIIPSYSTRRQKSFDVKFLMNEKLSYNSLNEILKFGPTPDILVETNQSTNINKIPLITITSVDDI
ncbi:unnamed protein product [Didymodactylos carnosus]|uniref:Uncharacterized protein n=1 Tax=Didymodactylos carnosus TaxID=1234261 RepID=A0A813XF96_9BILA|nr:unnamed protein product [Didymodactylos carnosus]CAF0869129.1 unnamed protein product [Didymodactylos carnosus]CAF3642004.1 unnamed protein product [Didymodactylos carnosus]CAF3656580.1 unnamed protein product [Didymodactylos carnosus]